MNTDRSQVYGKARMENGKLTVPNNVIIPFIAGDGIGPEISEVMRDVIDHAVNKAYGDKRSIEWKETAAGETSYERSGEWLPDCTAETIREHLIAIKGPLTTPVGEGYRSLNVALRQLLDLYVCMRPVRYYTGTPSPVKNPGLVDMVVFRENTEDVYAGIEWKAGSTECRKVLDFLRETMDIELPADSGIGIKPVSETKSKRLIRAAVEYALDRGRKSVTLVHKGNIQKYTEGAFRAWGYELIQEEYSERAVSWEDCEGEPGDRLLVKDTIADIFLQQVLTRPSEFDVIATMNLNGDYISDALAAQVGGIGMAPGGNINRETGIGLFEATHGTAPKYAGHNKVNPSSLILSGVMMLEYMEWPEAAESIKLGLEKSIQQKRVTYDLHRLMDNAEKVGTSEFGQVLKENI